MRTAWLTAALLGAAITTSAGDPPAARLLDADRGGLLYEQACGACHTTQAHWREKHLVHTWPELLFQVERWQRVAGRGWTREEMEDVAAYLNRRFYSVPCEAPGCLAQPT
ncbi:MAG TPA: hypothetical protein VLT89_01540 [Usitatibacter sp.]|nr:hypothetical protein [Usitatibacter sp.]